MTFSVLLPTRNRLELLKYAVATVLQQDYPDWEVIISDNCSEDDIRGYVEALGDSRIKYFRTQSFVPVTDNWNNALAKATGDYVIMLGDDDCLMKGYFSRVLEMIHEYGSPDFIYTSAYLYAYPGVMPGHPEGFLQPLKYEALFKPELPRRPFFLDKREALKLVHDSMRFRMSFGFNMQFFVISRRLIQARAAKGPFFQSPYPDFYAANVMFLTAERILISPSRLVTIGISPKSFGFFYFNKREQQGLAFLNNTPTPESARQLEGVLLPGTIMNTYWLFAVETIKENYGREFALSIAYRRYRILQILETYRAYYWEQRIPWAEIAELKRRLRWWETGLGVALRAAFFVLRLIPSKLRVRFTNWILRLVGQYPAQGGSVVSDEGYKTILDVYERVSPE